MDDSNINSINSKDNSQTTDFIDTLFPHSFHPLIVVPTRVTQKTATLIDNFFTNVLNRTLKSGVLSMDVADHCPIFLVTSKKSLNSEQTVYNTTPIYKRIYHETNTSNLTNDLPTSVDRYPSIS